MTITSNDWQREVDAIAGELSRDYDLLNAHHSQISESYYLTFLDQGRLFTVRLTFHDRDADKARSFNLRRYPTRAKLRRAIEQNLRQRQNGLQLQPRDFWALALAEKASQADQPLMVTPAGIAWQQTQVATSLQETARRLADWNLLLVHQPDGALYLTKAGAALLDAYFDVADWHPTNQAWNANPRIMTASELMALFL